MKKFLKEYGFVILIAIVAITIVVIVSPIGGNIKTSVLRLVDDFDNGAVAKIDKTDKEVNLTLNGSELTIESTSETDKYIAILRGYQNGKEVSVASVGDKLTCTDSMSNTETFADAKGFAETTSGIAKFIIENGTKLDENAKYYIEIMNIGTGEIFKSDIAMMDYQKLNETGNAGSGGEGDSGEPGVPEGGGESASSKYTLTFNSNGGTAVSSQKVSTIPDSLPTPTKTGYTFAGWYIKSDLSQSAVSNTKLTEDTTLYAKWNLANYSITYNLNGGKLNGQKTSYTINDLAYTLPTPTKDGYTFTGWTGSNGNTPQTTVTITKESSGDKQYTANWQSITYTYVVAYKSSSGKSLGSTTVQGCLGDEKTVTPPAKTGYNTPDPLTVNFDTAGSKTIAVTYKPVNYNISFVKNGGTYSEPATQYNIESKEIILGNANKTGYNFIGWYNNSSFTGSKVLSIPSGSTGNKTFYANFSMDSYSITYNLKEGTMSGGRTAYTVDTATFNLPTPSKTGYTFKGWTGTGLNTKTMNVTIPQGSTGDREYTANWEANQYTYTINYLSSTGKKLGSTTITNDFGKSENVTPPDYAGYTTPARKAVLWDSISLKTITFTYTPIKYTISYNLNGGSISGQPTSYTVESNTINLPTPTNASKSFVGWYENSVYSGSQVTQIPSGSTGNKTFYAKWELSKTYKLKTGLAFNKLIPTTTTAIVFTDEAMPSTATLINVDADGDGGVVAWLDGTTFKVSSQKTGQKIIANENSSYMFCGASNRGNNITTTQKLTSIIGLENLDTSFVINMGYMFYSAGTKAAFSLEDLSGWDTSSVKNMSYMFYYTGYNSTSFSLDLSRWNTSKVTNMVSMFYYTGYEATTWSIGDLSGWDTSFVINMGSMFYCAGYNATSWSIGDLSGWSTSKVTNMADMFGGAGHSATSFELDLSGWNTSSVKDMFYMFHNAGINATTWSIGDISGWDTSSVTDMSYMFENAGKNATYSLNLSRWNVNKVSSHTSFNSGVGTKVTPPKWKY